ncbi:hypothetical protein PRZ48_012645 [Zasmidium cellare]|uniref:NmrA-like domain-containing protein n=1 Tax=Zasmidium cellare TaxID=395010 RepID=A0ABR0E6D7_ZASCE|nr:hypothetical protein PRZ48_012645 [Zasmidium cellare]
MAQPRVGLIGATGETGGSILKGLIEDGGFDIIALARPESLSKRANVTLKDKGIQMRALDLEGPQEAIVAALKDIDILISAIAGSQQLAQIPLAKAAKVARIKRFVPCAFATPMPVGVHQSRDQKEEIFNLTKRLHLPYTIIDVGWWYQFSFPRLPSGKIDYVVGFPNETIPGDGNVPTALTDLRDVGKYVARVIKDERTLNKTAFVYNELWTQNKIHDLLEKLSGEKIPRKHTPAEEYERKVDAVIAELETNPKDPVLRFKKVYNQYCLSVGIRAENTPEYAQYLGYLDGKSLYPDVNFTSYENYMKEVVDGKAVGIYDEMRPLLFQALKEEH